MKRKIIIACEYGEIEKIIKDFYGIYYEIPCGEEANNDTYVAFTCKKGTLGSYDLDVLHKFKTTGKGSWILHTLVADLCNNGRLEEGDYVMNISW